MTNRRFNVGHMAFVVTIFVACQVEGRYLSPVDLGYWKDTDYTVNVMRPQRGGWTINFVNALNWGISSLDIPATVIEEWEDWDDLDENGNPKTKQRVCTVTGINSKAFEDCFNLTSVSIPNTVTWIGEAAFTGCSGLTHITIPDSVTTIEDSAFSGCEGLSSVTIGNGITVVPSYAFHGCRRLASVTIPTGVSAIGSGAFCRCEGLTAVSIPNTVTTIGEHAFDFCKSLTELKIPSSVTMLGRSAFAYSGLTSLTIPNSVTSLAESTFSSCESLERVTLPNMLVRIGDGCFYGCSSLRQVTIPRTVTSIDGGAFIFCTALKTVTFEGDAPVSVGNNAFAAVDSACIVRLPKGNTTYSVVGGKWQGMTVEYYDLPSTPTVDVDDERMEEPVVDEETGVRTIEAKEGETLDENDVAKVTMTASDGVTDITEAYNVELVDGKIEISLATPEVEEVEAEGDKDDPTGLLEDISEMSESEKESKIAEMPTPDTSDPDPEKHEEVGALPVKMYPGLWYQAAWGDSLDGLTSGVKFRADGTKTHIGVIKQKGDKGFYKLSVSEK